MRERPDGGRVQHGADADRTAKRPAGGQHGHLDDRSHQANLVTAGRERHGEAVAWARAEAGSDVQAGRQGVQRDPEDEDDDLHHHLMLGRHDRHGRVDAQTDHDGVGEGADAEPRTQRQPQQQDDQAGPDRPGADLPAERPRQALVQHVPRIDAEVGLQQQAAAHPVGHEPHAEHRRPR